MNVNDLFDLTGKVAIVTGASSGLGAAFAEAMAEAGAYVVCVARREDRLASVAETIKKLGGTAFVIPADVRKEDDVQRMVSETIKKFGKLDIIFNNAGIAGKPLPIHEYELADWNDIMTTNITGVFLCAREAARQMVKQKSGKIINISSMFGQVGSALFPTPAYCASKGAISNLTREMAIEYASYGINVNAIAPGFFRTELGGADAWDEAVKLLAPTVPMHGVGVPDDLKGTAVYLASRASDYVTGHILVVDAGYTAR
ncbi:MAG: glucose 1-dehydrogenase [Proteobacteria bacterium]|nr:glucose 1-dehydrogenase [Pseudomonadota bacterium]